MDWGEWAITNRNMVEPIPHGQSHESTKFGRDGLPLSYG